MKRASGSGASSVRVRKKKGREKLAGVGSGASSQYASWMKTQYTTDAQAQKRTPPRQHTTSSNLSPPPPSPPPSYTGKVEGEQAKPKETADNHDADNFRTGNIGSARSYKFGAKPPNSQMVAPVAVASPPSLSSASGGGSGGNHEHKIQIELMFLNPGATSFSSSSRSTSPFDGGAGAGAPFEIATQSRLVSSSNSQDQNHRNSITRQFLDHSKTNQRLSSWDLKQKEQALTESDWTRWEGTKSPQRGLGLSRLSHTHARDAGVQSSWLGSGYGHGYGIPFQNDNHHLSKYLNTNNKVNKFITKGTMKNTATFTTGQEILDSDFYIDPPLKTEPFQGNAERQRHKFRLKYFRNNKNYNHQKVANKNCFKNNSKPRGRDSPATGENQQQPLTTYVAYPCPPTFPPLPPPTTPPIPVNFLPIPPPTASYPSPSLDSDSQPIERLPFPVPSSLHNSINGSYDFPVAPPLTPPPTPPPPPPRRYYDQTPPRPPPRF